MYDTAYILLTTVILGLERGYQDLLRPQASQTVLRKKDLHLIILVPEDQSTGKS